MKVGRGRLIESTDLALLPAGGDRDGHAGESQVAKGDVVMQSVDSVDMHSVVNDH